MSILDVANTFLYIESMTHKKLQKLCYYAQAWYLALKGYRLFNDAIFEAWIHGPVSPQLYARFKGYGWKQIEKNSFLPGTVQKNAEIKDFIFEIHRIYGGLDGDQLEYLTHREEPWLNARKGLKSWQPSHQPIDENIMRKFCIEEYERSQND